MGALFGAAWLFALALVPSAALSAILPSLGNSAPQRFIVPILGLLPALFVALRAASLPPVAFALFGSVSLELFALTSSAPDAGGELLVWRTGGGLFFAWLCVWMASASLLLSVLSVRKNARWPRASFASAAAGSALGLAATLGAWIDGPSATLLDVATALLVLAAHAFARARLAGLRHLLAPLASVAALFLASIVIDDPALRLDAALAATAALLLTGALGADNALRRSQAATLIGLLIALAFSPRLATEHLLAWSLLLGAAAALSDASEVADGVSLVAMIIASCTVWTENLLLRSQSSAAILAALAACAALLRSVRDRSGLVWAVALSNWILAFVMGRWAQTRGAWAQDLALFAIVSAGAAALLRVAGKDDPNASLFGRLKTRAASPPLWFPFADGFALTALAAGTLVTFLDVAWLMDRVETDRTSHIVSMALVVATLVVGFFTRAFARFELRGRVSLLAAAGVAIGLAAVTNRIGRPLAPKIVAFNLGLGSIALWAFAAVVQRYGRAIGRWLDAEDDGKHYHWVIHAGVMALSALLLVDVLLLDPSTQLRTLRVMPPMMLLGPAICGMLLARSLGWVRLWAAAVPLFALGVGAAFANGFLGTVLEPLVLPGSMWVPTGAGATLPTYASDAIYLGTELPRAAMGRGLLGVAIAIAAFVIFAASDKSRAASVLVGDLHEHQWSKALDAGALGSAFLFCVYGFLSSSAVSAIIVLAALAFAARSRRTPRAILPFAAATVIHAIAQGTQTLPAWTGLALAALSLALAFYSEETGRDARPISVYTVLGALGGLSYAFATGATPTPLSEGPGVFGGMFSTNSLAVYWTTAATAAIAGAAAHTTSIALIRGHANDRGIAVFNVLGAALLALSAGRLVGYFGLPAPLPTGGVVQTALGFALLAAAHHVAGALLRTRFEARELLGFAASRALLTIVSGLTLFIYSQSNAPPPGLERLGLLAIAVIGATAFFTAWRQKTAWHVYIVYACITGEYAWVRWSLGAAIRPSTDASFAFAFAFVLVGVMVLLKRAGADKAAEASKRFAVVLPILGAMAFPQWQASFDTVFLSGAAAALYALLGWASNSRAIGALGAAGANLALLLLTLTEGISGVEVYLAPFGLFLGMLVHLFSKGTTREVRFALRFAASLLVFSPAALKLVFQIGNAQDDTYAFGFAGACLLAVVLGMALQIRAYLAFGLFFFLLDIGTLLTRASLRNQRVGFFVLSATGLAILASMVIVTTQREAVQRSWARVRSQMRRWD